ncbi:DUF4153 domain-containing protein [Ruminococcus flavefaciens]|uniref:Uncharacterized protein n=1 Tax=Ruminococcus flavefaciens 007c TaxID=1341157 RepID=W7UWV6_RUMFL|nr:DUF4173 domain-containing protein [Ruminococcus flavefaciens]EWM53130.1 hypothetical protein RF007C_16085 [Ruminococcus flavefaciens 007c]
MDRNNTYGGFQGPPCPPPPYPQPYPQPYIPASAAVPKVKEKPEYNKAEIVLSVFILIAAFCFVRYVLFHAMGFITTGVFAAIIIISAVYMKKKECSFSAFNKVLMVILFIFTIVFSITSNNLIKVLNALFLFGGISYLVYSVGAGNSGVERYLPFALTKAVFEYPFSCFDKQAAITSDSLSKSKAGSNAKYIFIGLLLTVPLTAIVAALLMSADDGVERILTNLADSIFSMEFWNVLIQLSLALPCSLYMFGMLYKNTHRKDIKVLDPQVCKQKIFNMRFVSNLVVYTAVTPICILYVMFFISQANYFLSAFSNDLPEGFTYADYARRGFFELFAVALINLGVLVFMSLHSKKAGKEKPFALKLYSIVLSVFTIILIATAMSKMVMYINRYGLTRLRVYTSWFMILLAFVFIMIIIKQFRFEMKFARNMAVIFTLMFAVLCFSRPEAVIVKYNIEMYRSGQLEELDKDSILEMSDDGLLEALREDAVTKEEVNENKYRSYERYSYGRYNISSIMVDMLTE